MSIMRKPESVDLLQRNVRIAKGFSQAARSYDNYAGVQEDIAKAALSLINSKSYRHGLDIGCGTGRHTFALTEFCNRVTGVDLAAGMVAHAQQRYSDIKFIEGMAEQLPIEPNVIDVVFSSMALQWCVNPSQVMKEIFRVLKANGQASLAIMVEGSFDELARARILAGQPKANNSLVAGATWQDAARSAGFKKVQMDTREYCVHFNHVLPLLHSIKYVGAGTLVDSATTNQFIFTRRDLNRLNLAYQKDATRDGKLPLTYRVCHLIMEK
ncbi:methyltransferase domain-containing protein [Alteromonas sp. ASW11-130]|uniref:methyltransferase domain-containing protein n=1 Tax=Alteromonas sp. ASW11-130 TaxID=3015775 RepID=UPI0022422E43|nr:methyltransferase domain-containing protein [Alteromonas sp. ASW11-130]MCW8091367.1 methyltransferase domain-containing protein [Alteromonas sp. ASW11-130]